LPEKRAHLSRGDLTHLLGAILLGLSAAMGVASLVGLILRDGSFFALFISTLITAVCGGVARGVTHIPEDVNYREGFALVTLSWVAVALFGALPYLISGVIESPMAALFESVSGFTTTGATVFADVEGIAPGILFWRSATQWLGGMGIIVLGVAILPYLGVAGMQLLRAEMPGPAPDRLRPRIRETAKLLWMVYAGLTGILAVLYLLGGMSLFDAVNHALTCLPTGGFSTHNASIGGYSPYIQWVTIVFMFLAGVNFTLHYRALTRGVAPYWRDPEWRMYLAVIAGATAVVFIATHPAGAAVETTLRHSMFQVVSLLTTTGYATADYELWAPFGQMMLFLLFFIGGMAGSTAGGPKVVRVLVILKHGWVELRKHLHPRAVIITKVGGKSVGESLLLNLLGFMILYVGLFGVGALVLSASGLSFASAASASATAISNVGPGLDQVGPFDNFGFLPAHAKLAMIVLMLLGRLEIYTVLILFHPGLWRR
jgi:trk system potassium uptake protein